MKNQAPIPGKRPNDERMFKLPAPLEVLADFMRAEGADEGVGVGRVSFDDRRLRMFMNPMPTLPLPLPLARGTKGVLNELGGKAPPSLALRAIPG